MVHDPDEIHHAEEEKEGLSTPCNPDHGNTALVAVFFCFQNRLVAIIRRFKPDNRVYRPGSPVRLSGVNDWLKQEGSMRFIVPIFFAVLMAGCGGDSSTTVLPEGDSNTESSWDEMNWDEGEWQ